MKTTGNKDIIFDSSGVSITSTLAQFGATTFSINGISRIYVKRNTNMILFWIALIAGLFALISLMSGDLGSALFLVIITAVFGFLFSRRLHVLMLSISSGDQQAFSSMNISVLEDIKAALEEAITIRG